MLNDQASLSALVREVWREMIPATPFDEGLTWREAGVDSLKSLHFLLRLEQLSGRVVSFDMITRDMTLGELVGHLAAANDPNADVCAPRSAEFSVFLVPGLLGDEPILAEFRRSLKSRVHFNVLGAPDIEQSAGVLGDIKASAAILVKDIIERQPAGPLYIAGYSIGGLLAFQAANDLIARGRDVRLVCMLDSLIGLGRKPETAVAQTGAHAAPPKASGWSSFRRRSGETAWVYVERVSFGVLLNLGMLGLARRVAVAAAGRHDMAVNLLRRRYLLEKLRGRAMWFWRPQPVRRPCC